MLRTAFKVVVFVATSAVAVPYTIAVLANLLYGWPLGPNRFKRALHPKKVLALNIAVLHQFEKLKYIALYLRWKKFYRTAPEHRVLTDFRYADSGQCLDLYFPKAQATGLPTALRPVLVFVYGGTWGSGDKDMYGLLCSQLADNTGAMVCCPNYSTYPRGFVDDMVQDVVDCLLWLQDNAELYNADKDRVMLVGHSAGAHLCLLAVLELTLQQLLTSPQGMQLPEPAAGPAARLQFEEGHFNGPDSNTPVRVPAPALHSLQSSSFYVLDNGSDAKSSNASDSFCMLDKNIEDSNGDAGGEKPEEKKSEESEDNGDTEPSMEVVDAAEVAAVQEEAEGCADSGAPEEPGSGAAGGLVEALAQDEGEDLSISQRQSRAALASIRSVIGLAGAYDISDHYLHEASRGVEDISSMAPAMYGPEHFQRFSPSTIVQHLPPRTRLPAITLVHGDADIVVPVSSTEKMAASLQSLGGARITNILIPECDHYAICVDLMEPTYTFHDAVMEIIKRDTLMFLS